MSEVQTSKEELQPAALAGGAAGAGAQVLTRGKELSIPAETVLRFRLENPVSLHAYHSSATTRRRLSDQ